MKQTFSKTSTITISALVAAMYIVVMYVTQGFAFGPIQMRVATALYTFSYLFPFLIVPLGLANALSNTLMGGLGVYDIVGGFFIGILTAGLVYLVRRFKLPMILVIVPVIFAPGFVVPLWLSPLFGIPYWLLVVQISAGQVIPAILGWFLIRAISKRGLDKRG